MACDDSVQSDLPGTPHITDRNIDKHNDYSSARSLNSTPSDQLSDSVGPPTDRRADEEEHNGTEQSWLTSPNVGYRAIHWSYGRTRQQIS
jgi:hypothetical protein